MKTAHYVLLLSIALVSCEKPKEVVVLPPPLPTPLPATPTPTPVPATPVPATPPPATPVVHLTPPGVYFVIQYIAVTTDSGIVGMKPGTRVKFLKEVGDQLLVTDGQTQFTAGKHELTNNLDVASRAAHYDVAAQQEIRRSLPSEESLKQTPPPRATPITKYVPVRSATPAVKALDQKGYDEKKAIQGRTIYHYVQ